MKPLSKTWGFEDKELDLTEQKNYERLLAADWKPALETEGRGCYKEKNVIFLRVNWQFKLASPPKRLFEAKLAQVKAIQGVELGATDNKYSE